MPASCNPFSMGSTLKCGYLREPGKWRTSASTSMSLSFSSAMNSSRLRVEWPMVQSVSGHCAFADFLRAVMRPAYAHGRECTLSRVYTDAMSTYTTANTVGEFRQHLAGVHARIAAACKKVGRDPASVRVLPVSKTVPEVRLRNAYAAGCRTLGENKVQEAHGKWQAMSDLPDLRWSIIGHLQTNKAKLVAEFASGFQALDSLRVAEALDKRLQSLGRSLDVLVQVNTSNEESKFGLPPDEVDAFVKQLPVFSSLHVRGLMTL